MLSACGAVAPGAAEPTATPLSELCADPLVVACEGGGGSTVVTVSDDASDERVIAFASLLSDSATSADDVVLRSESRAPNVLDPEVAPPPEWEVAISPGDPQQTQATLEGVLAAAAVPGAIGVSVIDGWPYVTVQTLEQFEDVFAQVSSTPLFEAGGTYTLQSLDERLRIVHVPARTSDDAILEIIDIARDYPDAEVLLEAPVAGPQFPTFYVSGLSPAQVQELDARLRDPRLAAADVEGLPVEYVLGSIGTDGTAYVGGTFGAVPTD